MLRWAIESVIVFAAVTFGIFSALHDRPWSLASSAVPSLVVVIACTLLWPRYIAARSGRDTWGASISLAAAASIGAYLVSLAAFAVASGALFSDPGDAGGALLTIAAFFALVPALVGVPVALLLPRAVDRSLRHDPGPPAA